MALATKCPHCNTVFRVAHDQLKLRGGIVRCGSCNEVFDGNAALLEPPSAVPIAALAPLSTPLPDTIPLDQKMAALDTRAAQMLAVEEAEPVLEFDSQADAPAEDIAPEPEPEPDPEFEPEPAIAAAIPLPATLTANTDALFDLDLDIESEPDLEASIDPEVAPVAAADVALADVESLSEAELEAALEAELEAMEQTLADVPHEAGDSYAGMSGGRIEPTWDDDDAPLDDEPQAGAGPGLSSAFAAADAAIFAAEAEQHDTSAAAPPADSSIDDDLASFLNDPAEDDDIETVEPLPPRTLRDDELDDVDEAALVELSSGALAEAQAARAHAYLRAQEPEPDQPEEPGFVKRDRQRQKYGKAATISMSVGSLLLLAALFGQAVTTFRNTLAASTPALKPLLAAACQPLGCKIELPTQIDDLTIEQGELQTLSDTTFSFATLLRNQSATAQGWPSIELMLDDDKDKHVLRRVFSPRDYLPPDVAADKGFAPHTEQAVKLYFELHDVKASGYHIAVFYP